MLKSKKKRNFPRKSGKIRREKSKNHHIWDGTTGEPQDGPNCAFLTNGGITVLAKWTQKNAGISALLLNFFQLQSLLIFKNYQKIKKKFFWKFFTNM